MTTRKLVSFSIVVLLVIVIAIAGPSVYVAVMQELGPVVIRNSGSVKAIGVNVYWDSVCTEAVAFIDWQVIEAGASDTQTIYIQNAGNTAATLALDTANWDPPSASDYLSLTWDYDGAPIAPDAVVAVILTLTVSASVSRITAFSFDIVIVNEA